MSTSRYRVIGSGMAGVEHIHHILALDDAIVTAVADPNPAVTLPDRFGPD